MHTSHSLHESDNLVHRLPVSRHTADFRPSRQVQAGSYECSHVLGPRQNKRLVPVSGYYCRAFLDVENNLQRLQVPYPRCTAREVVHEQAWLEDGILQTAFPHRFLNGGLTPSEADKLIEEGKIDAAVFGTLWIANPDLQKRIEKGMDIGGKGISLDLDPTTFYGVPGIDPRKGYTDYPAAN
ncbi:hypothetical protein NM688_g1897 [Phlebia brevispora]|uniref:Uncharacterized protein n=1 Tax=Phlebia brevispora TaxID=194682 RepID=A0ACC1TAD9_9APHY|nr:hypothetical protein NM688_g1897 [Phlebia brevispora]